MSCCRHTLAASLLLRKGMGGTKSGLLDGERGISTILECGLLGVSTFHDPPLSPLAFFFCFVLFGGGGGVGGSYQRHPVGLNTRMNMNQIVRNSMISTLVLFTILLLPLVILLSSWLYMVVVGQAITVAVEIGLVEAQDESDQDGGILT